MSVTNPHQDPAGLKISAAPALAWCWRDIVLLSLAILIAFTARWQSMPRTPTFDELWHLRLSAAKGWPLPMFELDHFYANPPKPTSLVGAPPVWKVWTSMDGVLHPPLFVQTLRFWRDAFGEGNDAARAYSIVWSVTGVAATFAAARLAMGGWFALLVTLVMSASPTQLYFAQQMRAYAMLSALAAITLWLMTRIEYLSITRRRVVGVALMTLPLMLTHYFAAGFVLGVAAYGLWRWTGQRVAFGVTLALAGAIYAVIWGPFAFQQVDDIGSGDVSWKLGARDPIGALAAMASAPFRLLVDRAYDREPASLVMGAIFVLPFFLSQRLRPLMPWAVTLLATVGTLAVLDVARSTQVTIVTRYLAAASSAVVLLLVGTAYAVDRRLAVLVASALVFMGTIYRFTGTTIDVDAQSYTPVAVEIAKHDAPGEPIAVYGAGITGYGDFVLVSCSNYTALGPRSFLNMSKPMSPELIAKLGRRCWLVTNWLEPTWAELVPGARLLSQTMVERNVYLYHLELPASDAALAR